MPLGVKAEVDLEEIHSSISETNELVVKSIPISYYKETTNYKTCIAMNKDYFTEEDNSYNCLESIYRLVVSSYLNKLCERLPLRDYYSNTTYYRMFIADMYPELDKAIYIDSDTVVTGDIAKLYDYDITDYDILVIEDIIDSGNTLYALKKLLNDRKPASLNIVTLLDKPERRVAPIEPDYTCFVIEDEFVIGYGLDYAEQYRNLPYVGVLKRSVYEK